MRNDWKEGTKFEAVEVRLCVQLDKNNMQGQGQTGSHFGTARNAEKTSYDFRSDIAAAFVQPRVRTESMLSSLSSLGTDKAALEQLAMQYFKTYECKGTELVSAEEGRLHFEPVLDGTASSSSFALHTSDEQ